MSRRSGRPETGATITTWTYQGRAVDLCITAKGLFYAVVAEDRVEAKSLDGLKDKLKKLIDSLGTIEIPVTLMESRYDDDHPEFTEALLVRLRRGHAVLRYPDGREDTQSYGDTLLRRLTLEEQEAFTAAWKAYKAAEANWNAIQEEAQRDPAELIAKAVNARYPTTTAVEIAAEDKV